MGIYRGLTPEQRSLMESDAEADRETYRGFYTVLDSVTRKGGAYDVLRHMLRGYKNDVDFVYLAMYDEETSAMVYIADSDQVDPLAPGEWEKVDRDQMMRFLNWDGEGDLYAIGNTEKYGWLCTAGCPIRDQDGEICEFLLVDVSIDNLKGSGRGNLRIFSVVRFHRQRRRETDPVRPADRRGPAGRHGADRLADGAADEKIRGGAHRRHCQRGGGLRAG